MVVAKTYAYHGVFDFFLSKTKTGRIGIYLLIFIYIYYLINEIFLDKSNDNV